ncbi:MAG: hypothetical protein II991_02195 [Bacteroidales bacterium]|nr:hypothetical protein [Bacteroidales bacterium]
MIELTPLQNLSNAIILQAAKDYRTALGGSGIGKRPPGSVIVEVERFFRSEWFDILTNVDGEVLIEKIRKEFAI